MPHPLLTIQSLGRLPDGTPCTTLCGDYEEIGALRCFGRYHLVPEGELVETAPPVVEPTPSLLRQGETVLDPNSLVARTLAALDVAVRFKNAEITVNEWTARVSVTLDELVRVMSGTEAEIRHVHGGWIAVVAGDPVTIEATRWVPAADVPNQPWIVGDPLPGESEPAAEPNPAEPTPEPVVIPDGDLPF